jgi:hypothetical protein
VRACVAAAPPARGFFKAGLDGVTAKGAGLRAWFTGNAADSTSNCGSVACEIAQRLAINSPPGMGIIMSRRSRAVMCREALLVREVLTRVIAEEPE